MLANVLLCSITFKYFDIVCYSYLGDIMFWLMPKIDKLKKLGAFAVRFCSMKSVEI